MKKPVEVIERRIGHWRTYGPGDRDDEKLIIAYLDSIPEDAHVCKWPKGVTKELLVGFAQRSSWDFADLTNTLRALAAIAPEKPKKRMVNFWRHKSWRDMENTVMKSVDDNIFIDGINGWRKVGGPFEVDA